MLIFAFSCFFIKFWAIRIISVCPALSGTLFLLSWRSKCEECRWICRFRSYPSARFIISRRLPWRLWKMCCSPRWTTDPKFCCVIDCLRYYPETEGSGVESVGPLYEEELGVDCEIYHVFVQLRSLVLEALWKILYYLLNFDFLEDVEAVDEGVRKYQVAETRESVEGIHPD